MFSKLRLNCPVYPKTWVGTGIDLSEGMLQVAKKRAADIGLRINLTVMDVEQLCFPDDSFDTVVETMSLCTFPNPISALQEIALVCLGSGRILLFEHGRSSIIWFARYQDRHEEGQAKHLGCQWNLDHNAIVQEAGLPIVAAERKLIGIYYFIEIAPSQVSAQMTQKSN